MATEPGLGIAMKVSACPKPRHGRALPWTGPIPKRPGRRSRVGRGRGSRDLRGGCRLAFCSPRANPELPPEARKKLGRGGRSSVPSGETTTTPTSTSRTPYLRVLLRRRVFETRSQSRPPRRPACFDTPTDRRCSRQSFAVRASVDTAPSRVACSPRIVRRVTASLVRDCLARPRCPSSGYRQTPSLGATSPLS